MNKKCYSITVTQVDNGYIVSCGKTSYVVPEGENLAEKLAALLVADQLDPMEEAMIETQWHYGQMQKAQAAPYFVATNAGTISGAGVTGAVSSGSSNSSGSSTSSFIRSLFGKLTP